MNRRYIATIAALAVSALAATGANAQTPVVPMGTADTVVDIASLNVAGSPVGGIDIGSVRSFASTDADKAYNPLGNGGPFAIAKVTLPDGTEQSVRSDGDSGKEGTTVPIGGIGSVTVGNLTATAGQDAASSLVNAVEGELQALVAGFTARAAGVNSVVESTRSATTNGAVVEKISVGLDDVVPAELLGKLPLDKVLELVDGLELPIDLGALNDVADKVRELSDGVEDVQSTYQQVLEAEDEVGAAQVVVRKAEKTLADAEAAKKSVEDTLNGLLSAYSAQGAIGDLIDEVEDTVDGINEDIEDTVDDVEDTVDDVEDTVDDVTGGGDGDNDDDGTPDVIERQRKRLADAVARVEAARDALDAANDLLVQAQAELDRLVDLLQELLDMVADLAGGIAELDVEGLYSALLEAVEGIELIGIDRMSVGVTTVADAVTSQASVLCELGGVRVLGQPQDISDCEGLRAAVDDVENRLDEVIALLPVQGVVPADVISLTGPAMTTSPEGYAAEGYRIATAKVSGLDLHVKPVALTQVADGVVNEVRAIVNETLGKLQELTGVEVPLAEVEAELQALLATLETLPVGDLLRDLETPAVDLSAIDIASRSTFRATGQGVDSVGTMPGSGGVVPGENLPHTGGGVGLALVLLAGGAGVWAVVRPRGARVGA